MKGRLYYTMADKKMSSGRGRTRSWATVVYPESAPEGWAAILAEKCIPCFISPLHDRDINATGEPKKPHYHVLFMFEGVKEKDQVQEIVSLIGGVGCEKVASTRGYARYLCHLDNPDKAQYDSGDVVACAGLDYLDIIGLASDKYVALEEMQDFVDTQGIISFAALCRYARAERRDWWRILCDCGSVQMKEYIKSVKWEIDQAQNR